MINLKRKSPIQSEFQLERYNSDESDIGMFIEEEEQEEKNEVEVKKENLKN